MTTTAPELVLMLTDHPTLVDVTPLARRGHAPMLHSVTVDSDGTLRGILATRAQMVGLIDLLEQALARASHIEREERTR